MDEAPEGSLEFWHIEIGPYGVVPYPAARGWLYEKPTPHTVKARIFFPRLEPRPCLAVRDQFQLSAYCANKRWMRKIRGEVLTVTENDDGSQWVDALLHRKS